MFLNLIFQWEKFIQANQPTALSWLVNAAFSTGRMTFKLHPLWISMYFQRRTRCLSRYTYDNKSLLGAGSLLDSSVKLKVNWYILEYPNLTQHFIPYVIRYNTKSTEENIYDFLSL